MPYTGKYKNDKYVAVEKSRYVIEYINSNSILNNGHHIISTENVHELFDLLDINNGIDGLLQHKDNSIGGLAIRIQECKNFQTFTIRFHRSSGTKTEYEKRKAEIYEYATRIYPHYTMQAYTDKKEGILGGGICKTKDLYDIAIKYEPFDSDRNKLVYKQINREDKNIFLVIKFSAFGKHNKYMKIF